MGAEQNSRTYFGNQGNAVYYCGWLPVSGRMLSQAAVRMVREATESETGGSFCSFCGTVFKITPSGTLSVVYSFNDTSPSAFEPLSGLMPGTSHTDDESDLRRSERRVHREFRQ